ncbi:melanoma-associated antigen B10-like [Erethizon dorsatum]
MPRGQKSKLRAREKRRQARGKPVTKMGAQATAAKKEESPSSSLHSKHNPERSSAAGATSSRESERAMAAGATGAIAASYTSSNEDTSSENGEMLQDLQVTTEDSQEDLVEDRVAILVHYLLCKYQIKEPVTKAEILRNVAQINKNQYLEVLKKASDYLELVFGLDVKEVDPNRNIYVLVQKLELDQDARTDDNGGVPKTGLLMIILGVIFTKGNCATEEQIWEVLNMMGIFDGSHHFFFGDARKLITRDLVKEKYLEYQRVPNSNPPCYEFLWGPRAHAETSKMKVLEFLAKIHNSTPSTFPPCYEEALKDEEERAQARVAARARSAAMASSRSRVNSSSFSSPK